MVMSQTGSCRRDYKSVFSRRRMLQTSAVGFGNLALASLLSEESKAESASTADPMGVV